MRDKYLEVLKVYYTKFELAAKPKAGGPPQDPVVWCGVGWGVGCGVVWCGVVWCGVV
jgi:hypothetical protein